VKIIGVILMIGGGLGLAISLTLLATRRRNQTAAPQAEVYEQRRYTEPPV
jgi:hypothetical protein